MIRAAQNQLFSSRDIQLRIPVTRSTPFAMVVLYHRTTVDGGEAILQSGFRDAKGAYGFADLELEGVWLSDRPLDCNEGAGPDEGASMLLRVVLTDETAIAEYEVIEEGSSYRTWCVPASVTNAYAVVEREVEEVEAEDDEELRRLRALAQQRLRNIRSRKPVT